MSELLTATGTEVHIAALIRALEDGSAQWRRAQAWGATLADVLPRGGRLLVAGNGGSAAQAQHLSAEIVGRYCADRRPFSAISLHTDASAVTAIANDYGVEEIFARQVEAHAAPNTVLLLMSTSGRSPNLLRAAERAGALGVRVWAMTGALPNALADLAGETLAFDAPTAAAVQELHLVGLHLLCEAMDDALLGTNTVAAS